MKLKGNRLYLNKKTYINLETFSENILMPISVVLSFVWAYWLMIKLPTWWAMFH